MKVHSCPIDGLKVIELDLHGDARGFFVERFSVAKFQALNLPTNFVQDNHSRSGPNILRGLHYQTGPAQGKLVGVTRGKIWDVAVDIRPESSSFGHHYGLELTAESGLLFWVPAGFAHGFCVLGDEPADLLYKVTELYSAAGDGGIRYDDPELAIDWPVALPTLSERDRNLPSFAQYRSAPPDWNR